MVDLASPFRKPLGCLSPLRLFLLNWGAVVHRLAGTHTLHACVTTQESQGLYPTLDMYQTISAVEPQSDFRCFVEEQLFELYGVYSVVDFEGYSTSIAIGLWTIRDDASKLCLYICLRVPADGFPRASSVVPTGSHCAVPTPSVAHSSRAGCFRQNFSGFCPCGSSSPSRRLQSVLPCNLGMWTHALGTELVRRTQLLL